MGDRKVDEGSYKAAFWQVRSARAPHALFAEGTVPVQFAPRIVSIQLEDLVSHDGLGHVMEVADIQFDQPEWLWKLLISGLPNLRTVRFGLGRFMRSIGALPHTERIIMDSPVEDRFLSTPIRCHDCPGPHTSKIVVNQRDPEWEIGRTGIISKLPAVQEVVIILHPWTMPPKSPSGQDPRYGSTAIAARALLDGRRVTVVNIQQLDFRTGVPGGRYPTTSVYGALQFVELVRSNLRRWCERPRVECWEQLLRFKSAQDYIEEIGWEAFQLEAMLDWNPVSLSSAHETALEKPNTRARLVGSLMHLLERRCHVLALVGVPRMCKTTHGDPRRPAVPMLGHTLPRRILSVCHDHKYLLQNVTPLVATSRTAK